MSAGQRQGQAEKGEAETVEQRVEHPDGVAAATNATRVFLTLVSAWFVPHGLQIVLYPWLLAVYLHLPPEQVGILPRAAQYLFDNCEASRREAEAAVRCS